MARTAWKFFFWDWPINPDEDSGWSADPIIAENNPINASMSNIQIGGMKSARRKISGWIWGQGGPQLKNALDTWLEEGTISTLYDHTGDGRQCRVLSVGYKAVQDASEWRQGRQTWRYDVEFIAV